MSCHYMKNQVAFRSLLVILFTVIFVGHASAQLYWSGAGLNPATAGSGTWDNANMQWSSTFPGYTAATWDNNIANFNGTGGGTVTIGANISVNAINFGANAGAFTLLNSGSQTIDIFGAGITNNSANTQTISNSGAGRVTSFHNSATAANATISNSGMFSATNFLDSATAANATINNSGSTATTRFNGTATAANATITNSGSNSSTFFNNSATAANATISNSGSNSSTNFLDSATAANATITNSGSNSSTIFFDSASGGNATLINANPTAQIDISGLTTTATTAGSIAGNGFLDLGSKNLAVGSNNTSTTFSGVIRDGGLFGSLTKVGTGTLILSGTNTYTGGTNIYGGVLQVDGSVASGVTVKADGTLAGTGSIFGNVDDNGIVSPGDSSPGTLTINANYTQHANATLRIEIGGLNAGVNSDLLQVNGAGGASLNGTLQFMRINNFTPVPGDRVNIINDPNGHTGMFSNVMSTFPGLIQPVSMYNEANDIYIVFALSQSFGSQAVTPNQHSVAEDVDDSVGDPRADALIAFLGSEPPGNLPHDYDLIAPEELTSLYEISFSQAVVQNNNLMRRMDDIRAGSNGYCGPVVEVPTTAGKDYDGKTVLSEKNPAPVYVPCPENHWGVFATGSGDFVNVHNDDSNAHGFDITTGDVLVGVDYRAGNHFAIGIDGSYSGSTADLVDHGRVEVDGGKVGGYATVYGKGIFGSKIYVEGAFGGGWNSYDTRRTGLQDIAVRGSTNGNEFNGLIAYGADWTFGCFNIGTWSTVQYTYVNIDGFTEVGSLAPLEIQNQEEDSFRATTGLRASYDKRFGRCGIFRPEIRAAWQHEYEERVYPIDARFASGAGDVFTVRGPSLGHDAALVSAGFDVQWNSRVATYVFYDGVLGRSNYDNNAVSGGFRFGF
jgi:outer membrane autotransporter protein